MLLPIFQVFRPTVTTGKAYDGKGVFLERFEYDNIKPDSYSFEMD